MFVQIVFDQTVMTFIDCHKKALKYFGGVPKSIKIDNLKSAVLEADFYEPIFQKTYASFANYYGFMAEPCRVYTPTDKGKIESNVKYVKNNCFKGREFKDIEEAKTFQSTWLEEITNSRIHGTTKRVPREVFLTIEKEKLLPLPMEEYMLSDIREATVASNCHITYRNNYYSVPYQYIAEVVTVTVQNNLLKVYTRDKEIALHLLLKDVKGMYQTDKSHYPDKKTITTEEIKSRLREEMSSIGSNALRFYDIFMDISSKKYEYRSISGILSLRKTYDAKTIDNACHRACIYGALKYKVVKNICEKGIEWLPIISNESYINVEETTVSRPLVRYNSLLLGKEVQ